MAIAGALHLGLVVMLLPTSRHALGDGGTALEAIAIEMIDALPADASPRIAPSAESVSEADIPLTEVAAEPAQEASRQTADVPPPLPQADAPAPEALPDVIEDAAKPPQRPMEAEAPPAPGQAGSTGSIATAEASPGVVNAYGRQLAAIISQGRPRGSVLKDFKGKVLLAFSIDTGGRIERIDVQQSSGNPELDGRALSALRKLTFPAPPPAMSERQRFFSVPFEFR